MTVASLLSSASPGVFTLPTRLVEALRTQAGAKPRFIETLHPKQKLFVLDPSPRKAALCGRRSGKTSGIAAWFVEGMLKKPGSRCVYITQSAGQSRRNIWDKVLTKLIGQYHVPLKLTQRTGQLMVEHPNGSSLWLVGCADRGEMEKFRGDSYYRVCIDEAQAFGDWLGPAIEDSIEPALMDLRGTLALAGTPGPAKAGYFFEVTTGMRPGWSVGHHWTVVENPHMPEYQTVDARQAYLDQKRATNGWDLNHPTYRREWMAEWIDDTGALIYPFTYSANAWTPDMEQGPYGLPPGDYRFGLGIDLGFGDRSTAFVLVANRLGAQELFVIKSYVRSRMIPTALAAHVQQLQAEVRTKAERALTVVVDEGALGKGFAEQMRVLGAGCIAAQKSDKRSFQEYVGGLISGGHVKASFSDCRELLDEARKVQYDADTGKEDERYQRHCCDALLYIVRHMLPRYRPELEPPKRGTPEAHKIEEKAMREHLIKEREKRLRKLGR